MLTLRILILIRANASIVKRTMNIQKRLDITFHGFGYYGHGNTIVYVYYRPWYGLYCIAAAISVCHLSVFLGFRYHMFLK